MVEEQKARRRGMGSVAEINASFPCTKRRASFLGTRAEGRVTPCHLVIRGRLKGGLRSMRNTKDRIADTALCLFNRTGTEGVSTNHIAAAMEISPGNLYYHYANKDEILLVLLERLATGLENAWAIAADSEGLDQLRPAVANSFALFDQYRFFAREVFALAHRSPALGERMIVLAERCIRAIEQRISTSSDGRSLATAVWLLVVSYAASAELRVRDPEPISWSDEVESVLALLEPFVQLQPSSGVGWTSGEARA